MTHSRSRRKYDRVINSHIMKPLVQSMIRHSLLKTSLTRAKALKMYVEPLITYMKKNREDKVRAYRYLVRKIGEDKSLLAPLYDLSTKYQDRPGGYTRIIKAGYRKQDCCPMAYISFV